MAGGCDGGAAQAKLLARGHTQAVGWVYARYGRQHAALCATAMCFGPRGAIRDMGKVMGLPEDVTGLITSQVWAGRRTAWRANTPRRSTST